MAEAIVFEVATVIVSEVVKRVMEDFKLPWVTKSDLKKLKIKLEYLQAMLHDAGSQQYEEKRTLVNEWMKKVMDVVYYIEDVLDEYGYEELRKKVEVGSRFKLKGSIVDFHRTNPVFFKIRIAKKANKAMSLLEAIFKEAHELGIKPVELTENERTSSAFERYREEREFASYTSGFVGRKHDVSKIVELLHSNPSPESSISVVAIVGMGGLGKTTLARRVYGSEAVRVHFHKTVWICASENFSIKRLLNEMVESLKGRNSGMLNAEAIERELRQELEGQRYLLVLDDVWNKDRGRWESLLNFLYEIGGSPGTKVLVTTRNREVVETMQARAVHTLKKLSEEESWALFQQIVFKNEPTIDASDLVAIGKRILEKCKGVPLAIKMLGGLLRSKKNAHEWELIERSEIWKLPQDEFGILPSLLLSFYYLPSPVKQCFSYCAIFPKDAVMSKNDLIRLWLARGFLHVPGRNNLAKDIREEDIGEEYFNILLNNSFLLLLEDENDDPVMDMDCKMHDLVHDMALFVSQNDCLSWKKENNMDDASNVRHLALLRDNLDADYEFVANGKLGKLRTVHSQVSKTSTLLLNASHLRVLKLSNIGLWEIPASIRHLKHCRYLDLSHTCIGSLPDSITELYNLQTLQLEGCDWLHKFPEGMSKLVNLRHLPTSRYMEMPAGMKYLTHLQTLPRLSLQESGGCTIDEIGCLHDVRGDLCIKGLEFVASKDAAVKASMGEKKAIVSLELQWAVEKGTGTSSSIERVKDGSTDEDVLDGLRPHPNLKRLVVSGYKGKKFAPWLKRMTVVDEKGNEASLNNLVKLCLSDCKNCKKLPTLGQLPRLRDLEIRHMKRVKVIGLEFYVHCEDSSVDGGGNVGKCGGRDMLFFRALRKLRLIVLPALTEWMPPPKDGTTLPFPCLEFLEVSGCPRLISTPAQFPCLNRLSMERIGSRQPLEIITHSSMNLRYVELSDFSHVTCLHEELRDCRNLEELHLYDLSSLISLPSLDELKSLRRLEIMACKGFLGIPSGLDCCTSLTKLEISGCDSIETVPDLRQLTNLETLRIFNCKKLTSLPEGLECLHGLHGLSIGGFQEELEYFPDVSKLADLKSLSYLDFFAWPKLKYLPDEIGLLTTLKCHYINGFSGIEVPEWIGNLSGLINLYLDACPNLKHLPSQTTMLQLKRLTSITISGCPHLIANCAKDVGPEWHKISHVPDVDIGTDSDSDSE